jgi:hypothetical protein
MSATLRDRREQLEQRLRTALLRAEKKIDQAKPENQQELLRCYGEAISRFRRLVVLGEASKLAKVSLPR